MSKPILYTKEELLDISQKIIHYMNCDASESEIKDDDNILIAGCKLTAETAKHARDTFHNENIVQAYIDYPPFLFYTDPAHEEIMRTYGMITLKSGEVRAHCVIAALGINHDIEGGLQLDQCIHVKEWSQDQLKLLDSELILCPEIFTEPFGFVDLFG